MAPSFFYNNVIKILNNFYVQVFRNYPAVLINHFSTSVLPVTSYRIFSPSITSW